MATPLAPAPPSPNCPPFPIVPGTSVWAAVGWKATSSQLRLPGKSAEVYAAVSAACVEPAGAPKYETLLGSSTMVTFTLVAGLAPSTTTTGMSNWVPVESELTCTGLRVVSTVIVQPVGEAVPSVWVTVNVMPARTSEAGLSVNSGPSVAGIVTRILLGPSGGAGVVDVVPEPVAV